MMKLNRARLIPLVLLVSLMGVVVFASVAGVSAQDLPLVQADGDRVLETAVLPGELERISWGSVIAASLIALIFQVALNLLGIGIGVNSIHPNPAYGEDSTDIRAFGVGAAVWVGVSTLVSLFVGGFIAARFAGIPNDTDGLLHGLTVWAIVTIVTIFLLTTTVGRLIGGAASLLGQGLGLAGRTVQAVGGAAASVAQAAGNVAGSAVGAAAQGVANAAQGVAGAVQNAVDSSPEAQQAVNAVDPSNVSMDKIRDEAFGLLRQAGISPENMQGQAKDAVADVSGAVQAAVQHPGDAQQILGDAIDRVFRRGQDVANQVTSDADRDALVRVMTERTGVTEQQAREQIQKWQGTVEQTRRDADKTMQDARAKADDLRRQAEQTANQVKQDAERVARETAATATQAVSRIALIAFAAILVSAIAAGLGGIVGAPDSLPFAEVTVDRTVPATSAPIIAATLTPDISPTLTTTP